MKSKELGTKHFVSMYSLGPTHAHNTHHAYIVRGATPNSCVEFICPNSHLCCLGMRNDRLFIPELVLPIASKRWVAHYPKVTKIEKQINPIAATINQANKGALMSLNGYIFMMSIWGSCLKLYRVELHLWVILVFPISISTCSGEALTVGWTWSLSLSLPLQLCQHIQFPRDMCIISILYACIFNSLRICAQFFSVFLFDLYGVSCPHVQFP